MNLEHAAGLYMKATRGSELVEFGMRSELYLQKGRRRLTVHYASICMLTKLLPHVAHAYALRRDMLPNTNRTKHTFFATRSETANYTRCRQDVLRMPLMPSFPVLSGAHNASDIRR